MAMAMLNKGRAGGMPNGNSAIPHNMPPPAAPLPISLTTTTYPQSKYKKLIGTISLTEESLTFHPADLQSNPTTSPPKIEIVPWTKVMKHQVSPISHPTFLLKIILHPTAVVAAGDKKKKKEHLTFELKSRAGLDRIRRDITGRLSNTSLARTNGGTSSPSKKRPHSDLASNNADPTMKKSMLSTSFTDLDPDALAVTRSSLLSSNPTLRAQHTLLVTETKTLTEDDFWVTHSQTLSDEYAKIYGKIRAGMPSSIKSNLDLGLSGRVKLGVEEMRQIFIMYPAVHCAYEAKVPLELSEEQFWRKYLESEYFHRDRGRIGSHVVRANQSERKQKEKFEKEIEDKKDGDKKNNDKREDDETDEAAARSRAIGGTDDIFSRYDVEWKKMNDGSANDDAEETTASTSKSNFSSTGGAAGAVNGGAPSTNTRSAMLQNQKFVGTRLAIGQFDLASTAETERASRILNALDLHPPPADDSKGARVIDKYNRHWALVLHPDDAVAGCDLKTVTKRSVHQVLDGDEDAKVNGGVDNEFRRLVGYANADENNADHAKGIGDDGGDDESNENGENESSLFRELALRNIEAYSGEVSASRSQLSEADNLKRKMFDTRLAEITCSQVRRSTAPLLQLLDNDSNGEDGAPDLNNLDGAFPPPAVGVTILGALTSKMAADSKTESDIQRMASGLPEDFKKRLTSFFRRSSELLRHFFGLRRVMEQRKKKSSINEDDGAQRTEEETSKLQRVVQGMEAVYREMEVMRKELPQSETGEIMRKMCLPIMDQLDCAFQLHRDGSGGGGGFVTVEEI
uniref:BSD domain-containing protein n=1 Tax=Ditylum brightwellii TaxID=49249 RepID=A0A7S4RRM8_9STRA